MTAWAYQARATIDRVHATLSPSATLAERVAAVDAAYPFGERAYWPYKAWLAARKTYLCKYGYRGARPAPDPFEKWARDPVTGRPVIP